jgi:hypothetical protein
LGYHVPGRNKYGNLALRIGRVSNLRQQNLVTSPTEFGRERDCNGKALQQL